MQLPTFVAAAAAAPNGFRLARVGLQSLDAAFVIESGSYPEDEAATRDKLELRIREAPEFFYGIYHATDEAETLCGFVCGTLTALKALTEEGMSTHEPAGTTLCIHSVVIERSLRRQGLATWMLKEYLRTIAESTKTERVLLICKDHLVGFYESCGFGKIGLSEVVHGQDPWYDMGLVIR